jgi:magnesium transporter
MVKRYDIDDAGIVESAEESAPLLLFVAPDEAERSVLRDHFGLAEYDLASTLDPDEAPRAEALEKGALLIWKVPESARIEAAVEFGVHSLGLVLAGDRLAFVLDQPRVSFTEREFRNARDGRDVVLGFLLHGIRHYVGHLRVIKQIGVELERKITVSNENRYLLQMFALGESLVYYLDAIEGNGAMLQKLRALATSMGWDKRQLDLLDDVILENSQAARQANIYSTILSGLMDARGTIVNNNMSVLLKNLTMINIIFLPLNLIASIGGMSEWTMMTQGLDWRISYALFLLAMVLFGWLTLTIVRKVTDRRAAPVRRRARRRAVAARAPSPG